MQNVSLREEKFIADNDVVSTIITSNRPVLLQITGRSFASSDGAAGKVLSLDGRCSFEKETNSIIVEEGGKVSALVHRNPDGSPVYVTGKLMYDGMTAVLTASRRMQNVSTYIVNKKTVGNIGTVCGYAFYVPVDNRGITIS